jgi:tetratricopeptide (TPR) repeat protein
MIRRSLAFIFLLVGSLLPLSAQTPTDGSRLCAECHAGIFRSYRNTGMARSFFRPQPANTVESYTVGNQFYHDASATHYEMVQRDGKFYQRRYQIGFDGKETNVDEKQVDFVMGSGTHARAYLHLSPQGTLVQLPLGWYSEKGGYWAMSPGYDTPRHPDAQRPIGYDCMFCHNAYPQQSTAKPASKFAPNDRFGQLPRFSANLPEGIDCQRCHGSGARHMALAGAPGANPATLRAAILNPARLSLERQSEVCMQCHLQPNSFQPTNDFKRYALPWFSYQPDQPLSSFMLWFDAPEPKAAAGNADRFQIAGSAYRLRQSACFLQSAGKLQCTTCHNPHDIQHGAEALQSYNQACATCHTTAFRALVAAGRHTQATGCVDCHMPKRRTQDVVHVVMTDHLIQRRPGSDLLAERAEIHDVNATSPAGPVQGYYPRVLPTTAANRLALAIAQIRDNTRAQQSLPPLLRLLQAEPPSIPDPFFEAAEAQRAAGHLKQAVPLYQEAIRRDGRYVPALLGLGTALLDSGQFEPAAEQLRRATSVTPGDAALWSALGRAELASGRAVEAKAAWQKAVELNPESDSPHIGLGVLLAQTGDVREAEAAFREAIRLHPNAAETHSYLANLLVSEGDLNQAAWEFERAVLLSPDDVSFKLQYAALLYTQSQPEAALRQVDSALHLQPQSAEAHHLRGNILEKQGHVPEALREYAETVRLQPGMSRAQLDFGVVLAQTGDKDGAIAHLKLAANSQDENVRRIALQSLAELGIR